MVFNKSRNIILLLSLLVLCLLSLKYFSAPWIWIYVAVIVILIISAFIVKSHRSKLVLSNLLALPAALLLAESYLYFERIVITGNYTTDGYYKSDEKLGYAPIPGIQRTIKRMRGGEVIYDVIYTINANGLRSTPSSNSNSRRCILFFGGSFMFGEGLNDNETLPYFMGKELNENYRIFNFGFHGYGPHQMLSAIENGLIDNLTKECSQIDAIYSSIPGHVARTVGYSPWDQHGPKYVLENDVLMYKGHFDDFVVISYFIKTAMFQLRKSLLFMKLFFKRKRFTNNVQKDLFIKIIERSQYLLHEINQASRFIIIFWDTNNLSSDREKRESSEIEKKHSDIIIRKFLKKGFEHYLVGDVLGGYRNDGQRYVISQYDRHPNYEANELLAIYLAKKLEGMK